MGMNREEVKKSDTWDLESLYSDEASWEADLAKLQAMTLDLEKFKGKLGDRNELLACFRLFVTFSVLNQNVSLFASRRHDEDQSNTENSVRSGKLTNAHTEMGVKLSFVTPELASYPDEYLKGLLDDEEFADFSEDIKGILRNKEHFLSEVEEELLSKISEVFGVSSEVMEKLTNIDITHDPILCDGEEKELTDGNYTAFLVNPDRNVRGLAMRSMMGSYRGHRETLTATLAAHVKQNVLMAKTRNYGHVIDKFLHGKAIPADVYKTLFDVTGKHAHLLHRYCEVRRKAMGLEELHWYDLYPPIVGSEQRTYTYEEAVEIIRAAVAPLGSDYVETLMRGLTDERWVDRYENEGKQTGAYSGGGYGTLPFILMNFNGTLESVYTLAHEGGHSMHTLLASAAQPYDKYRYVTFIAEIASTLNEQLVSEYLLNSGDIDDATRAFILNKKLESIRSTFFRQTMFAEFEAMLYNEVWNGTVLTPDFMEERYHELNRKYYGPDVIIDDEIRAEWSRIPHFYYNFYVYQYATGISCALHFANQVTNGGDQERENFLNVLRAGGSDDAVAILKGAGLDVTAPDYLLAIMSDFERTLDEFEALIENK